MIQSDSETDSFEKKPVFVAPKIENPKLIPFLWNGKDSFYLMILLFLSVFSRFWILWNPRVCISYEHNYLQFLHKYANSTFFYDSEPYLGKIINSFLATKMGYSREYANIKIDTVYQNTLYNSLRSISAFFATATVPFVYCVIRINQAPSLFAFTGGMLCLFEPSLISTSRFICDRGIAQLFIVMCLLFSGAAYHYDVRSNEFSMFSLISSCFAGFALSTTFSTFSLVCYTITWTFLRSRNKKLLMKTIVIPFSILIITCFIHIIQFTSIIHDDIHQKFSAFIYHRLESPIQKQFKLWHIIASFILVFKLICVRIGEFRSFSLSVFIRRLFLCEKSTIFYQDNNQMSACFNNLMISFPTIILAILLVFKAFRQKTFDNSSFFSIYMLFSILTYSLEPNIDQSLNCYVCTLLCCILHPLLLNRAFQRSFSIPICIIMIFVVTFSFIDSSSLIYANSQHIPIFHLLNSIRL